MRQQRAATRIIRCQAALEKIVAEMNIEGFTLTDTRRKIESTKYLWTRTEQNREKFQIGNGY
jgi:hypothetical protein